MQHTYFYLKTINIYWYTINFLSNCLLFGLTKIKTFILDFFCCVLLPLFHFKIKTYVYHTSLYNVHSTFYIYMCNISRFLLRKCKKRDTLIWSTMPKNCASGSTAAYISLSFTKFVRCLLVLTTKKNNDHDASFLHLKHFISLFLHYYLCNYCKFIYLFFAYTRQSKCTIS